MLRPPVFIYWCTTDHLISDLRFRFNNTWYVFLDQLWWQAEAASVWEWWGWWGLTWLETLSQLICQSLLLLHTISMSQLPRGSSDRPGLYGRARKPVVSASLWQYFWSPLQRHVQACTCMKFSGLYPPAVLMISQNIQLASMALCF